MNYYRDVYLNSDQWKKVRNRKARRRKTCAVCGAEGPLDAHHVVYPKDILNTKQRHLRMVCRRCHDAIHELKAAGKLRFKKTKVNSIWAGTVARLAQYYGIHHRKADLAITAKIYGRDPEHPYANPIQS
jgi:hypothetical protein